MWRRTLTDQPRPMHAFLIEVEGSTWPSNPSGISDRQSILERRSKFSGFDQVAFQRIRQLDAAESCTRWALSKASGYSSEAEPERGLVGEGERPSAHPVQVPGRRRPTRSTSSIRTEESADSDTNTAYSYPPRVPCLPSTLARPRARTEARRLSANALALKLRVPTTALRTLFVVSVR